MNFLTNKESKKIKVIYEKKPIIVKRFIIECPHCKGKFKSYDYFKEISCTLHEKDYSINLSSLKQIPLFKCPRCKKEINKKDFEFEYIDHEAITNGEDIYKGVLNRKTETIEKWEE